MSTAATASSGKIFYGTDRGFSFIVRTSGARTMAARVSYR
jgi:hypothetical protein